MDSPTEVSKRVAALRMRAAQDRVRRRWRRLHAGTTEYVSEEDRQACTDAGLDDFLGKPVSPKYLENRLAKWRRSIA